ncbi:class I SAM-dependent methyltransferase [Crossiella cryophila]|uniref:SAM-dependent methyltransferase n=1 Tax=Crossiella cryophila TaxID=43355 RepID=A0A7W7FU04_9PSEU|nr:class I SAM-dependent methyltransferase [Crossiella cryophila]MBB4677570.1 SAM-dependent methyltransferase [Crossiella cryophila]
MDETYWDTLYRTRDQVWSGAPNGVLVVEITGLPPGRALEVGCGEGADAIWLAEQGWRVTAADISQEALTRADAEAKAREVTLTLLHSDIPATPPPVAAFDLVALSYFPLHRSLGPASLRALAEAVAPGGTLLVVSHDLTEGHDHRGHDGTEFRMADFYAPTDFADQLGAGWTTLVDETRPRVSPAPPGTPHTHDTVFRAQRHG